MNIKAVELMQPDKNTALGIKAKSAVAEPPVVSQPQTSLNGLQAQGMNNVAFMGKSAMLNKLKGNALGAMMALAVLGGAGMTTTSCSDTIISQEVSVDMTAINAAYQQMLKLYQQMIEQQQITNEQFVKMNTYMQELLQEVKDGNLTSKEFYEKAYQYMVNDENSQKLIINQLIKNGNSQEEANKILQDILNKVDEGQMSYEEALNKIYSILGSIDGKLDVIIGKLDKAIEGLDNNNSYMKAQLEEIKNYIKTNNEISADQKEILESILVNVNKLGSNDEIMNALNTITEVLRKSMAQDKEMDSQTHALLKEALNYIAAVGFEMNRNFGNLINEVKKGNVKLDELTALVSELKALVEKRGQEGKELGDQILNYIAAVGFEMNRNFSAVLEAINKGAQGSDSIKALLEKIIANQDNNRDAIIKAMGNIKIDGSNIDLSSLEAMMKELLKQSKANGETLASIDGKMDLMNVTAKAILSNLEKEAGKNDVRYENIKNLLENIKNKVGSLDGDELLGRLDKVLAKLDEIKDAIQNHKVTVDVTGKVECKCDCGRNHEGILGEIEDLMK